MPAAVAVRSSPERPSPAVEISTAALGQALVLACSAVVLLEIAYTRLFSFKLFYYFTYLIIGIALLGGGSGGVAVALSRRLRRASLETVFGISCVLAGAAVLVGYWPVALTPLNAIALARAVSLVQVFDQEVALAEAGKLVFVCASVFAPFFAAGVAVSKVFATRTDRIGRLYFADLIGAGIGCALAVPALRLCSPPGAIQLGGALFVVAALRVASRSPRLRVTAASLLLALVALAVLPRALPDPVPDREKTLAEMRQRGEKPLFSAWDPVFRVDVLPGWNGDVLVLAHDGMWGAIMKRFDGDASRLATFDTDVRALPFRLLPPHPSVAIIGAAGGHEVLASLRLGAARITALELNPVTVSLLRSRFADFTGHVAADPRVTLVNTEARSFLARSRDVYDLVWFVAPDSYAAMNAATSGAFVLSESYLYSAEMIRLALSRLTDEGLLCAQFGELSFARKPLRTARYVSTARAAFGLAGIPDFPRHVLVTTTQQPNGMSYSTVLLRKAPFTERDVLRFADAIGAVEGSVLRYPPPPDAQPAPVSDLVTLPDAELEAWYRRSPFDLSPVTDDSPFFWHFVRFRDAARAGRLGIDMEQGLGERLLLVLLAVSAVFAFVSLLGPFVLRRSSWSRIGSPVRLGLFFAAIGLGFVLLEVGLIQRLTLFLGYPTYTLTVTLCALLVSAGTGSLLGAGWAADRDAILLRVAAALGAIILFYCYGLGPALAPLDVAPFPARVLVAVAVIAPLGLCLGHFMPIGLRTVAGQSADPPLHVAWAWAVNGFFSVLGSVLATILSMALGFRAVFLIAGGLYALAVGVLLTVGVTSVQRPAS